MFHSQAADLSQLMQEASLRTLNIITWRPAGAFIVTENTCLEGNVWNPPVLHHVLYFLSVHKPNRGFRSSWWFIDEGPGCTTKRLPLLTPTTTESSPWNLGRNWSPRTISDWFRGRKRHSTFMLHSAGTSAIAQIQGGGRMLLSAERERCCWGRRRPVADRGLIWPSK